MRLLLDTAALIAAVRARLHVTGLADTDDAGEAPWRLTPSRRKANVAFGTHGRDTGV